MLVKVVNIFDSDKNLPIWVLLDPLPRLRLQCAAARQAPPWHPATNRRNTASTSLLSRPTHSLTLSLSLTLGNVFLIFQRRRPSGPKQLVGVRLFSRYCDNTVASESCRLAVTTWTRNVSLRSILLPVS